MTLADAIERIRPATVQICVKAAPRRIMPVGTGFMIDETTHVVTADHVVSARDHCAAIWDAPNASVCVGLAQPNTDLMRGNFTMVDCDVVARDERHDAAVLRLRRNPFVGEVSSGIRIGDEDLPVLFGTTELETKRPRDGESVASSGYPLASPVLLTTSGHLATAWDFDVRDPTGFGDVERSDVVADVYVADMTANVGNSGGPVYSVETGKVLGVCVAYRTAPLPGSGDASMLKQNSGLTLVVPIRYPLALI